MRVHVSFWLVYAVDGVIVSATGDDKIQDQVDTAFSPPDRFLKSYPEATRALGESECSVPERMPEIVEVQAWE